MGIRLGSKEQEELVLNNEALIHYHVKKLDGISNSDYEDIVSIGRIGLVKAAATFDESQNIKFGTYASQCIKNEIYMYFRKTKSHINDISLDQPIMNDGEGNEVTLGDKIPNPDKDFTEIMVEDESFIKVISIILNVLKPRESVIMLYKIAGNTQEFIAENLNVTQSCVSRNEGKIKKKVQKYLNSTQQFNEIFKITKEYDTYKVSFNPKDIKQFNKNLLRKLQNLATVSTLPDVKIIFINGRIVIETPAHPEFLNFIAQIIKEIEDFNIN